jgi:hypothetical protein
MVVSNRGTKHSAAYLDQGVTEVQVRVHLLLGVALLSAGVSWSDTVTFKTSRKVRGYVTFGAGVFRIEAHYRHEDRDTTTTLTVSRAEVKKVEFNNRKHNRSMPGPWLWEWPTDQPQGGPPSLGRSGFGMVIFARGPTPDIVQVRKLPPGSIRGRLDEITDSAVKVLGVDPVPRSEVLWVVLGL